MTAIVAKVAPVPAPDAQVVELADAAHLSEAGRTLFFGTHPQILAAGAFARRCDNSAALGSVSANGAVGCFQEGSNSIVLYAPADPRLHGTVVEGVAHETLHAAWARFSAAERDELGPLLEAEVVSLAADDPLRARIAASVGQSTRNRPTELFAYVGTTIWRPGGLAPQLEAIYARFISDREALVAVHTDGRGMLVTMSSDIEAAAQALVATETANAQRHAQLDADTASVDRYRQELRAQVDMVAAMPAYEREVIQLGWRWWDGTELPMAPAATTLAAAGALLARDEASLPAQAAAIEAAVGAASAERTRVDGLIADLEALQAQLDPATSPP